MYFVDKGISSDPTGRVLYQFPRRDALSFSLSSDVRALGVVSSKGHTSLKKKKKKEDMVALFPLEDNLVADFLSRGDISPVRLVFESLDFPEDLSGPRFSTGDQPFCVHSHLSTSQVLCLF